MPDLVGVVDPGPVYRRGLSGAFEEQALRVRELEEGQLQADIQVDVLVIDASVPGGRELIRDARTARPDTPVVAIVPPSWNRPSQHGLILSDGATAAVSADAPPPVVASSVRAALADWAVLVLPGDEIRGFFALFREILKADTPPLEDDEVLLLQRLFQGATRQTLAEEFSYGLRTLDRRIEDLHRKLGAHGHTDAMLRALLSGYLTSTPNAGAA